MTNELEEDDSGLEDYKVVIYYSSMISDELTVECSLKVNS